MQRIKMILGGFFENCFRVFRKFIFSVVSVGPIPTHIAFIMDGNRRYARKHKLKEGAGHRIGLFALMSMLKYCYELGVKYVTVYAFSIDNFNREPKEVQYMMTLVEEKIEELLMEGSIVSKFWVRLHFIGNLKLLNATTRAAAERAMTATAMNNNLVLVICLAYSSTDEVVNAVQKSYENKWCKLQGLDSSGCGSDEIRLVDRSRENDHGCATTFIRSRETYVHVCDP